MITEPGTRLLIVDDSPLVLGAIVRIARARSIPHVALASLGSALAAVNDLPVIAVITDFDLGEARTGADVLRAVRTRWPDAKRVLMSGSSPEVLQPADLENLAHRFVEKPFNSAQLVELLEWASS